MRRKPTLIEWFVVAVVIAILMGILYPSMSGSLGRARGISANAVMFQSAEPALLANRMLIWKASLTLEVRDVAKAVPRVEELVARLGGYIESRQEYGESQVHINARIPSAQLTNTLQQLEGFGGLKNRELSSIDVTEQHIDIEAKLRNDIELRNRLRELLGKAVAVQDILNIETQLARVQGEVDSLEGRLKALRGNVEYAEVQITLKKERILGPLGLVLHGIWWAVRKLFVIQ